MTEVGFQRRKQAIDTAAVLARLVLGGLFVYMGLKKAIHPDDFRILIREYDMVSSAFLLNAIAATLPWFETFCGLLLLAGIAVRGTAVMLVAMLIPFTLLVLRRALAIAAAKSMPFCMVKFDCGCGAGEVFICHKLWENTILVFLALWLIAGFGRRFSFRYSLFRGDSEHRGPVLENIVDASPSAVTSAGSRVAPK
jgi:uncharacterized membrane protein YphA (DoxX/SURF4 family)